MDKEIAKLPKIDLHRHLDGDVRPELLFSLARKDGVPLPADTEQGLLDKFAQWRSEGILSLLQNGFGMVTSLMQTPENIQTVAYEEVRNLANDDIVYAEVRFAPEFHTGDDEFYRHMRKNLMTYQEIISHVAAGLRQGAEDFGVATNIIVCIDRGSEPAKGVAVAQAALDCIDAGVVGIDLACYETAHPPEKHLPAYKLTFGTPLKRTVHAGEFGPQREKNIVTSIAELKADRLGHAIPLSLHPELVELVDIVGSGVEMCPESNKYVGLIRQYSDLGIPALLDAGIKVSLNSDDPAMFGYRLSDVFCAAVNEGFTKDNLRKLQLNAVETAFISDAEKSRLAALIRDAYR
ncbi:adenosine deaminase [Candidatus Woesearchaeota archaeon]|nr:adenosine deaminase [Candidatus Woesearchaeota archaeon]